MFEGIGTLHYGNTHAILWIDQGVADFYKSLVPKSKYICRQRNAAHITVVRGGGAEPDILKNLSFGIDTKMKRLYTTTIA